MTPNIRPARTYPRSNGHDLSSPLWLGLGLGLCACAGGSGAPGGAGAGGGGGGRPADVETSLALLGVDTTRTPRKAADGSDLPENYGPLGTTWHMVRPAELLVAGLPMAGGGAQLSLYENFGGVDDLADAAVLVEDSSSPWIVEQGESNGSFGTQRAFSSGDLDGDGREEIAAVRYDRYALQLLVIEDQLAGFAQTTTLLMTSDPVRSLDLACGDFDGDGRDELAVGVCDSLRTTVHFFEDAEAGYAPIEWASRSFEAVLFGADRSIALECGNLDQDRGDELALVRNEILGSQTSSRYAILDDAAAGFPVLVDEYVRYEDGPELYSAVVADLALGDFDGDLVDEIAFGGLRSLPQNDCGASTYLAFALDDATHGFASLGGRTEDHYWSGCPDYDPWRVRWVEVNAADLDGDRIDELQVNQYLYQLDWRNGVAWRPVPRYDGSPLRLSEDLFFDEGQNASYDRSNSAIVCGDVTGDGLDDLIVWREYLGEVRVVSPRPLDQGLVFSVEGLPTGPDDHFRNPVLLATDVNDDGITLVRTETDHELLFTEPVVLAVLAAAPCSTGIGQNLDGCSTTFGNTVSNGSVEERSITATSGVTVGIHIDGGALTQSEFEMTTTLSETLTETTSEERELSTSLTFSTGPMENMVVFTTVPMDRYTYRVLAHSDGELVGREILVDLPRKPILLQTEREFYNANVIEGSLRIGADVFQHTVGDHRSYKTVGEKNQTIAAHGGHFEMQSGPVSVGQGTVGSTEVGLTVGKAWSEGESLELDFEMEVRSTVAGVLSGFSVGGGEGHSLQVTSGRETTYTGSVGTIPAESFVDNLYSFGLFAYVYRHPANGQQFQVVDYWVE